MAIVGGSQIDVQGLVAQLVAAERAPHTQRFTRQEVQITTKISALGTLKGALSGFKTALDGLRTIATFDARKATSADTDMFTASAGSTAVAGSYQVEVLDLAQAHQLRSSAPFAAGASTVVGTGTLTVSLGSTSFNVTIDATNQTLAGIAAAINSASGNPGVGATLVNGVGGSTLVLSSSLTGASNTIRVTQAGGNGGLSAIAYDPPNPSNMTETLAARDARISVAGIESTSSTNVFTSAIDGVTITAKAETTTPVALDVTRDNASAIDRIRKFVTEYNSMHGKLAKLRSFDPTSGATGPMFGDALLRGVEEQIRRGISDPVTGLSGDYTTLASVGIRTNASGNLELDETKLTAALNANFTGVAQLFGSTNGVAARIYTQLETRLSTTGEIESRNSNLNKSLKDLERDKAALEVRMATVQSRYLKQFTALDTLLSSMQSTSAYLTQQLANLPKSG